MRTIARLMPDDLAYAVYACLETARQHGQPGLIISLDVLRKQDVPWDVVQESAWKAHIVIKKYFGFGLFNDMDPFPDDYQARITEVFEDKHLFYVGRKTYLTIILAHPSEYVPDEAVTRWLQQVHDRHASQETNHFFFKFPAERLAQVENFASFAKTLGAHNFFASSLKRVDNLYAPRRSFSRPLWPDAYGHYTGSPNAFGHDTYELISQEAPNRSITVIPTLDFFYARDLNGYNSSLKDWSTYEGTRKLWRIQRNLELFRKLQGTFIWCCPSFYRYGRGAAGVSSFEEAPAELDLSTVYEPLIADIMNAKPPEHDPGYDMWLGNFGLMIKILWNEKTGMFQRTPIRPPNNTP